MKFILKFLKIIPFLLFFGSVSTLFAQAEKEVDSVSFYNIKNKYPIQDLSSKTEVVIENAEQITINDILQTPLKNNFTPIENSVFSDKKAVWLHINIHSNLKLSNQHLIFKRNNNNKYEYVTAHDSIQMYLVKNNSVVKMDRLGVYVPASAKKIKTPVTVDRIPISFEKGEQKEFYIKIMDKDSIFPIIELRNPSFILPIEEEGQTRTLTHFALILSFYVLCFFFFTRDRSYIYLFGLFLAFIIHYQILSITIWPISIFFPEHPQWIEIIWIVSTTLSAIFLLQFARKFTDLKQKLPLWDKITFGVIIYLWATMIVRLIIWNYNSELASNIENPLVGIAFLAILIIVTRIGFYKDLLIRYFVLGVGWLIFWDFLGVLWQTGILPFWESPNPWVIAQGGFMLILSLAIARKMQLSERAKAEVEKIREIDSVKSKFFANISHEFRTPLSLILGPVNQSLENIPAAETIEDFTEIPVKGKHLKVMKRNALRLQNLVDQILDLSKLDQGEMKLQVRKGNLIQFLRSIVFSFESLTELKHIHFQTHFSSKIENAYFDSDKLEKIVVNLLSNAIKFTPEHGKVSVIVEDINGTVKISITDTGNGIKKEDVANIFDRFYQTETTVDQGTGIGLALVKELIELYHGQINVDSIEGKGTTFKMIIPYQKTSFQENEIFLKKIETNYKKSDQIELFLTNEDISEVSINNTELPLLLIVEDNPDLRQYIAEQLENDYNIATAKNGKEGLKIAMAQLPDLVISDVMMPKMNGIELCEALKKDIKTSHIPVILLTAKAGQTAKIEGLETGVDDYLTKPFDGRELLARVKNLIAQREVLRAKFTSELKIRPSEITLNSMDERFVKQVMEEIEKNIGNEFYAVEDLATAVGFSRSQLNRKVKVLLGKSPNQLIREFRLTRAKEMLEQKSASVSEIAYQVGYSNLSYFSKSYKEAFGVVPSES